MQRPLQLLVVLTQPVLTGLSVWLAFLSRTSAFSFFRKDVAAIAVRKSDYDGKGPRRDFLEQLSQKYLLPIITCEEFDQLLQGGRGWSTAIRERAHALIQKSAAMGNTCGFI